MQVSTCLLLLDFPIVKLSESLQVNVKVEVQLCAQSSKHEPLKLIFQQFIRTPALRRNFSIIQKLGKLLVIKLPKRLELDSNKTLDLFSHCKARCMFLSPSARLHSCELLVIKLSISPIIFSHIFLAPPPHFPRCTKTNIFGVIMVVRADISHYNPWCSQTSRASSDITPTLYTI